MPKNMSLYCGGVVYNAGVSLGQARGFMHTQELVPAAPVEKPARKARVFTQAYSFLYTFFQQYYTITISVISAFVHIFHSAYKKNYEVYKGGY